MAVYFDHLEHHEDKVPKHSFTKDDIAFLIDLQKEMCTQDSCGNRDPRYFVIKGSEQVYGSLNGDPVILIDDEEHWEFEPLKEYILQAGKEAYASYEYENFRVECKDTYNGFFLPRRGKTVGGWRRRLC